MTRLPAPLAAALCALAACLPAQAHAAAPTLGSTTAYGFAGTYPTPTGTGHIHDVDTDSAGNVYVADYGNSRIRQMDAAGAPGPDFHRGLGNMIDSFFDGALGIHIDAEDRLWVAANWRNRIHRLNSARVPDQVFSFTNPLDLVVSGGSVYIIQSGMASVHRCDLDGTNCRSWSNTGRTTGIAADDAGSIYVSDIDNGVVRKYTADGLVAGTIGSGHLNEPYGVGVDRSGDVWVMSAGEFKLKRFASDGTLEATFGSTEGSGSEQFGAARFLSVGPDEAVYVADHHNARVQLIHHAALAYAENGTGEAIDPNLTLSDSDGSDITSATVTVSGGFSAGDELGFATMGSIRGSLSGSTLTLTGTASASDYQAALRTVSFRSASDDPGSALRTVRFRASDGGESNLHSRRVKVTAANDAPAAIPGLPVNTTPATWGGLGAQGGQLHGPNGVARDSAGNVYVAESEGRRVQKFDSSGNFLRAWGWGVATGASQFETCTVAADCRRGLSGSGDGQFSFPVGIAIDVDGNVLVAENQNRRVQKFSPDGSFIRKFGSSGGGAGQLLSPEGLATDAAGNVYVADSGNHRVVKFDSSGNHVLTWGRGVANGGAAAQTCTTTCQTGTAGAENGELNDPTGVAVAPDGSLYVAERSGNRIQRFSSAGAYLGKWGSAGSGDGQFASPFGVGTDGAGNVYVTDQNNYRVQKFDPAGTFLGKWGSQGTGAGQFAVLAGVMVDPGGTVTVADFGNARLARFSPLATSYTENGAGTAVDPLVDVADRDSATLAGATVSITGNFASGEDVLSFADTASISGSYDAAAGVLTLTGTASVAHFEAALRSVTYSNSSEDPSTAVRTIGFKANDGSVDSAVASRSVTVTAVNDSPVLSTGMGGALSFAGKWSASGAGETPWGVAVDSAGYVYVTFRDGQRVQKFDSNGALLTGWGSPGDGDGQFRDPVGVAVDSDGNVYVAERGNDRVQKFDSNGRFITKWGRTGDDNELYNPYGVAVDSVGNVYVADMGNSRVQKFDSNGRFITRWGSPGSGDGQFLDPAGVAVDSAGNVYVTDMDDNRVQKFDSSGGFITKWGSSGSGDGQFDGPVEIHAAGGMVYVSDRYNHRVQMFDADGRFVTRLGGFGYGDGQFRYAGGISSIGNVLYVVDSSNDRVQLLGTGPPSLAYTEGDGAKIVAPNLTANDPDNANLASATVSITAGLATSQDVLAFTPQSGITGTYNALTGALGLTGTATVAEYQAALRTVTYRNTSGAPSTVTRTIEFKAADTAGAQSNLATRSVAITATNSAPTISATAGGLSYSRGQAATAIDPGVAVDDVDNATLSSASVSITGGFSSGQDLLGFSNQNGISGSYNAGTGVLALTGRATVAQYQAALRSVTYRNSAALPSIATRTITFSVSDGALSAGATRGINVSSPNIPPTVTTTGSPLSYVENAAPTAVDPGLALSDLDSPAMSGATVSITGGFAPSQDVLGFANQNGITGSYDSGAGVLVLAGASTRANYEAALRSVTYRNASDDPSIVVRTVSFRANDGTDLGVAATRRIAVTAVNDAPAVTSSGGSLAYTEGDAATSIDPGLALADVDSPSLTSATVSIGVGFAQGQDVLAFANQNGIGGSYNTSTGVLALTGTATVSQYQAALRSVGYRNTSRNPSTAGRTVTFTVSDGAAAGSAGRTVTVAASNDAPAAVPDTYSVAETATLSVPASGVLANDSDPEDGALTVGEVAGAGANVGVQQTTAKGGKVTLHANGSLGYDPNGRFASLDAGETSTDSVSYKTSDGSAFSNTATVTITVTGVNDAPVAVGDSYSVGEDGTLSVAADGVLANDGDAEGNGLTVREVAGGAGNVGVEQTTAKGAKVTLRANGSLDYDPNGRFEELDGGETASDSITYKATDGSATSGLATVTFTIDGANDAPVGVADGYEVGEDAVLSQPAAGVLSNDADADVEPLAVARVDGAGANVGSAYTTASGAKVTIRADGSLTYDPSGRFEHLDVGESDSDSVTYTPSDGTATAASPVSVVFTIVGANDAPAAAADSRTVGENGTLTVAAPGVLENDSDVDVEPLSVAQMSGSAGNVGIEQTTARGAKVTLNANGSLSYDPNGRFEALDDGESATDSISYRASDGAASSATAKVSITIEGQNDGPAVRDDSFDVGENGTLSQPAAGVLANDFDVDVEPLSVARVAGAAGKVGVEQTTAKGALATINADGSFAYDPDFAFEHLNDGETETDSITYSASDGSAESASVTLTITVHGGNDSPTAIADSYTVGEDGVLSISPAGLVGNDGDVDSEGLHVSEIEGEAAKVGVEQTTTEGAKVTVNATGSVDYDPDGQFEELDDGETVTDSFAYKVSDGVQSSGAGTATITIVGANDAPAAVADSYTVGEDAVLSQGPPGVLANDSDVDVEAVTVAELDGDPELVGIERTTAKGAKLTVAPNGSVSYDPNGRFEMLDQGETATDSFEYRPSDGSAQGGEVTVTITVNGANDAPSGADDPYAVGENGTLSEAAPGVVSNDSDVDVEPVTVGEVAGSGANVGVEQTTVKGGKVTLDADGSLDYDPNGRFEELDSDEAGSDSVVYRPSDGTTVGSSATVSFAIAGANDAPVAVADSASVGENGALRMVASGVLANDTDIDVEPLAVDQVAGAGPSVGVQITTPKGALVTVNTDGSVTYDPNRRFEALDDGESDSDSISYRVSDGTASSNVATLTVTVDGANDRPALATSGSALGYTEGDAPTVVDAGVTVDDVDDADIQSASVTLTNPKPGDELAYAVTAGVNGSVNGAKDTVTLTGARATADYQAALRAVKFVNRSADPDSSDRSVSFAVSDGDADSYRRVRTIDFTAVNDRPTVATTGAVLGYTEGDAATVVDGAVAVADVDDARLESAEVRITNAKAGDELAYATTAGIGGSLNVAKDTLTLTGSAAKADYQAALRAVQFRNTRDDLDLASRTVTFAVNDGDADSDAATRTIGISPRPPVNTGAPAVSGPRRQGSALSVSNGSWTGTRPMNFSARWQRCSADGGGCADLGATGSTYVPQAADVGWRLRAVVTADNSVAGTVDQPSEATAPIRATLGAPTIVAAPGSTTSSATAEFSFTTEDGASAACSLDGAPFASCSSPVTLTGLADGGHSLRVRQSFEGVVSEPAAHDWVVDTGLPVAPIIIGAPPAETGDRSASFEFQAEPGAVTECRLDGAEFALCASPVAYTGLALGPHSFEVRQIDAAGNVSATARHGWRIDVNFLPGDDGTNTKKVAALVGSTVTVERRQVTVGCELNAGSLETCTVDAFVDTADAGAARTSKLRRIGRGRTELEQRGRRNAVVAIALNRLGHSLMRKYPHGLRVVLAVEAKPFDTDRRLTTKRRTSVRPPQLLVFPSAGLFDGDSARLDGAGRRYVAAVARILDGARGVRCEGHADSSGAERYARRLGLERARAVCRALRRAGLRATMSIRSYGSARPRATNKTATGRRLNRRVEIRAWF